MGRPTALPGGGTEGAGGGAAWTVGLEAVETEALAGREASRSSSPRLGGTMASLSQEVIVSFGDPGGLGQTKTLLALAASHDGIRAHSGNLQSGPAGRTGYVPDLHDFLLFGCPEFIPNKKT